MRTLNVDTPVAAAICAQGLARASSPRSGPPPRGVSFDAPFGPRRAGTSPATPPAASAWSHRQTVAGSTPNASATWAWEAARSRTSCTAASRRPASSPASHANVASPCTITSPPSLAGHQAHARGDLRRPSGQQRERQLGEHAAHHPPHPPGQNTCNNFLTDRAAGRDDTPKMQISPATTPGRQALCQESWGFGRTAWIPASAQDRVKRRGELPGPVTDQEPEVCGAITQIHQQVADLLHGPGTVRVRGDPGELCVPKTSSTSCDQAIFVDQATDASLSSDAVVLKVDRFG